MHKNKQTWSVKTLVFLALLVAIQLVLSRVLVIDLGVYRITLGTVATVLAGLWMGPVAGGVEGAVADIIGCFMKGYGDNPLITLSAVAWGVIPGLAGKLMAEKNRKVKTAIATHITTVFTFLFFSAISFPASPGITPQATADKVISGLTP